MLELDVTKQLGVFRLDARFRAEGKVTALFGRSGSGKTTLTNLVAGLVRPDRGRVVLNESVVFDSERGTDVPPHRRRLGYIFQEGRLLPHLTVRANLLYGFRRTPASERSVGLDEVVGLLGIEDLLERWPGVLSGGEKQRVAIGRALLASPRMLLMDEPLASLDNLRKAEVLRYIERLRDELSVPIVYVSHSIEEVTRLAHTMVVLSEGSVVAQGTVRDIMSRLDLAPFTGRFEAGAVIEARVAAHDLAYEITRLEFAGGELFVTGVDALVGEPVRVRVRARDVALALERPGATTFRNIVKGRVAAIVESDGPMAEVQLDAGGATLVARITRQSLHELGLREGASAYALIKAVALDRHSVGYA